jgi:hypothetical protein
MLDFETFLITVYVLVDTFCKSHPPRRRPGPPASLSVSEVVTLVLIAQWGHFRSERDFYGWAQRHLRSAFPTLPDRTQFNRLTRRYQPEVEAFFVCTTSWARQRDWPFEILDGYGVKVRNLNRRGSGWLDISANKGQCSRLGWHVGFRILDAVTPEGFLTGLGFGPASTNDMTLAETFFALRQRPDPRLVTVGRPSRGVYLTDRGFNGYDTQVRWVLDYQASVVCPPRACDPREWPAELHRLAASLRQIVETVHEKLLRTFRLETERPHTLGGFGVRLAAKAGLHNICLWLNRQLGRPLLAFADLIAW